MKRLVLFLLCVCLLSALCSCSSKAPEEPLNLPPEEEVAPAPIPEPEPEPEPDPLEDLLASLTLEEKVGQLFFVRCPAENAVEDIKTYHLGGYLLFERDFKDKTANEIIQTIASYQDAACHKEDGAEIPLLIGVDEEGGTVVRVSSNPNLRSEKFKSPQWLWNHRHEHGNIFAEDAREKSHFLQTFGIHVNFAPVADISTDPNDFIYDRTLGQDAVTTAEYIASVVCAMSDAGTGSVLKHFPGYGNNEDTHTGIAVDDRPFETFRTTEFLPFIAGIERGGDLTSILMSHNIMTCVDAELPASLSPAVHGLVRKDLDFDGVIMTDDLAMEAVAAYAEDGAVAVMAIEAGNDIVLTTDYRTQIPKVLDAVKNGSLSEEQIDTACRRVLIWKAALGLIGPDFKSIL